MKGRKNKSFSLIEINIALFILTLSVSILVSFAVNYLVILNSIRERFIALNLTQEGLELAFGLRNKLYEIGNTSSDWTGVPGNSGKYCLSFATNTGEIVTSSSPASEGCEISIYAYTTLTPIKYKVFVEYETFSTNSIVSVTSTVKFRDQIFELNSIMTKF